MGDEDDKQMRVAYSRVKAKRLLYRLLRLVSSFVFKIDPHGNIKLQEEFSEKVSREMTAENTKEQFDQAWKKFDDRVIAKGGMSIEQTHNSLMESLKNTDQKVEELRKAVRLTPE